MNNSSKIKSFLEDVNKLPENDSAKEEIVTIFEYITDWITKISPKYLEETLWVFNEFTCRHGSERKFSQLHCRMYGALKAMEELLHFRIDPDGSAVDFIRLSMN